MMQTLSQAELDDAYHHAIFDCDQALADYIRRAFKLRQEQMAWKGVSPILWDAIRDDLHDILAHAFHDCEFKHLGPERYDQLMDRLWQRNPEQQPV
ncbi:hypothetical protein X735_01440 [Mesorhizobium sp. L2C085B000]|uniref:hypothetical protein n=1 Tax=Mesorhizobium sp. L2C085B000 TaxID=1287117 RepID=UPI0003CFA93D|nr:hypothetical protein [Mesorhizobium sp. L2C085B000]ESZ17549.1 hypothetical protein X735_01440 [Mesorhizobium sp. L2C085B000]